MKELAKRFKFIDACTDIQSKRSVIICEDSELQALKHALKSLEQKLSSVIEQRDELNNVMQDFNQEYHLKLGAILRRILSLREKIAYLKLETLRAQAKEKYTSFKYREHQQAYEEARHDSDSFQEEYHASTGTIVKKQLSPKETKELKTLYRKASKICHPDVVNDELKEKAHELMIAINAAYKARDTNKLKDLLFNIETGVTLTTYSNTNLNKTLLVAKITELKQRYEAIQIELQALLASESYASILALNGDWNGYFSSQHSDFEIIEKELIDELRAMTSA